MAIFAAATLATIMIALAVAGLIIVVRCRPLMAKAIGATVTAALTVASWVIFVVAACYHQP